MSDRQSATELNAAALGRALRGLPSATPPEDGWTALAASLRSHGLVRDEAAAGAAPRDAGDAQPHAARTPRRATSGAARRRWLPAALAAALAAFAITLLPTDPTHLPAPSAPTVAGAEPSTPDTTATAPTGAAGTDTELALLRGESARIEEWLRLLKADETPLDGRSLMAATEIEDMIGLIDLQLAAGGDGGDTQALWRSRVALLRDLAAVRTTYSLAGTGIAANGTAAAPDNWNPL